MTGDIRRSPVAVVTGGGSGIGRAVALGLAGAGYSVVVAGRGRARLEETAESVEHASGRILAIPTDVSDNRAVNLLFEKTAAEFGRLDLLFNNAGSSAPPLPLEELEPEQWRAVMEVNVTGAFFCSQRAMALMKRQVPRGGRIINNVSVSAHVPRPFAAPYTASKHALTGLTKAIALEGRAHSIACGQIDVGNAATLMTEEIARGALQADGSVRAEPRIDIDDVVKAVLFMASLPLDANVQFLTLVATGMPFIGRG